MYTLWNFSQREKPVDTKFLLIMTLFICVTIFTTARDPILNKPTWNNLAIPISYYKNAFQSKGYALQKSEKVTITADTGSKSTIIVIS